VTGKIKNGLELSRQSWAALRQNRQLMVFPFISMVMLTVLLLLLLVPVAGWVSLILDTGEVTQAQVWAGIGIVFLYYLVASIIVIFSNAALTGASLKLIAGEKATVSDGLRIAFSHFGKIIGYALISATVGVVIRFLIRSGSEADNIIVKILSIVVGSTLAATWSLAVFFAIPVMIYEDLSVRDALKRAAAIFKKTWGEGFTGDIAIGGFSCLMNLLILIVGIGLAAIGVAGGMTALIILGLVVVVIGSIVSSLLYGAVNGIFQASLYHFAVTGSAGPFIDTQLAQEAFQN
jgi:membrane-anchored glycerophosphoryl diester phosphodiesterase (GDPDase)